MQQLLHRRAHTRALPRGEDDDDRRGHGLILLGRARGRRSSVQRGRVGSPLSQFRPRDRYGSAHPGAFARGRGLPRTPRLPRPAHRPAQPGAAGRAAACEALPRAVDGASVALLSIDLDGFKTVNDSLGRDAGDELLRQVARRLDSVRRTNDMLVRQGGDEFTLLAELEAGLDATAVAVAMAERIRSVLEESFTLADAELRITASVGAAIYPEDALDARALRNADSAMYAAKEDGSGFALYRPGAAKPIGAHVDGGGTAPRPAQRGVLPALPADLPAGRPRADRARGARALAPRRRPDPAPRHVHSGSREDGRDPRAGRLGAGDAVPPGGPVGGARSAPQFRHQRVAATAGAPPLCFGLRVDRRPRRAQSPAPDRGADRVGLDGGGVADAGRPGGAHRRRASVWRSTTSAPATRRFRGCAPCPSA